MTPDLFTNRVISHVLQMMRRRGLLGTICFTIVRLAEWAKYFSSAAPSRTLTPRASSQITLLWARPSGMAGIWCENSVKFLLDLGCWSTLQVTALFWDSTHKCSSSGNWGHLICLAAKVWEILDDFQRKEKVWVYNLRGSHQGRVLTVVSIFCSFLQFCRYLIDFFYIFAVLRCG